MQYQSSCHHCSSLVDGRRYWEDEQTYRYCHSACNDSGILTEIDAECFYNKDGKWYYAGVYRALRLQDLTAKEWEQLSDEVRS